MKTKLVIALLLIAATLVISPYVVKPASAHITKAFGNYLISVGWDNEPALTGQKNAPQVTVEKYANIDKIWNSNKTVGFCTKSNN
jgi:hypothetical protein